MALKLVDCDSNVRLMMLEELDFDTPPRVLYISKRLNAAGQSNWRSLLTSAFRDGDDLTLAASIKGGGFLSETETQVRNGKVSVRAVPVTAAETLSEGEFNRFYIRGLCRHAQKMGITELEIYRAKEVANPRVESEAKIGTRVNVDALLKDLRDHSGVDLAFGIPSGPNSGLSVRMVRGA